MIKTIFFDFGNVIAFFDHGRAVAELVRFTDMPPVELALALYGGPIADDYECGTISTAEYVREALLNGRLGCTDVEFLSYYHDIFWENTEVCELIPMLKPRYRLVLASNTNEAHFLRYTRDYADVLAHFDHLVVSHHAGARKPHPEFFAYAKQFAHADPAECVFVDDLPVNVEAADRAGLRGVTYTPDGTLAEKLRAAGVEIS
ncbi:MAG: yihX [Gemmataceae bacterium]|nr:yihX [Gemmataceae bacterium]